MSRFWLRWISCLAAIGFALTSAAPAQNSIANDTAKKNTITKNTITERVLERYRELRPTDAELGMYRLDWAPSLEKALERAQQESRPVLLVVIHAKYGDITGGHC